MTAAGGSALADLIRQQANATLSARCGRCRHATSATLAVWAARHGLGWNERLRSFVQRLRCSRCGARNPRVEVRAARWP